jgi:hypothetical protein
VIAEIVLGMVLLVGFGCYRAVNSDGWDDSNILNWLRLFSMVCIHPEEFAGLYRLTDEEIDLLSENGHDPVEPFDFISKDEFAENFPNTRSK